MRNLLQLFFMLLYVGVIAQTSINEKFNAVNGQLPQNWKAFFDSGLNYNTSYSYGIDIGTNSDDRALAFVQDNSQTEGSGWVLTSKMSVTKDVKYEYSFYVQLYKNTNVKYVFAYGDTNETSAMTNILKDHSSTVLTNATDEEWVKIEGDFIAQKTEDIYFGFKGFIKQGATEANLVIDNILIRKIIECSSVTDLTLTSVTETTAEITWNHSVAEDFNVKVFEKDASFDTETPVFEKTVTDKTVTVTGLQSAKVYDVYVQSNCGNTKGLSEWSSKFNITTSCKPEYETFSEDFGYSNDTEKADIPLCWSKIVSPESDKNFIQASYGTLIMGDAVKEGETNMLISPKLSTLKANANYRLRLDAYLYSCQDKDGNFCESNALNFFEVGTMSDPNDASTFTSFKKVRAHSYGTVSVNFTSYKGTDSYIAIKRPGDNNKDYTIGINSLHWEEIPEVNSAPDCLYYLEYPSTGPTNTVDFKDVSFISWSPVDTADSYILKIGLTEGGGDIVSETTVNDTYYRLSSSKLDYGKKYYVTLIPKNSAGEATNCTTITIRTTPNKNYGGGDENTIYGGYYFSNSTVDAKDSSIKPTYNWIDPIANNHTKMVETDWKQADQFEKGEGYYPVGNLQFDFPYYGNSYGNGSVYINRNGAIHFDDNIDPSNTSIGRHDRGGARTKNTIMGFLTSFRPDKTDIYYHATANEFIVTWYKAYNGIYYYMDEVGVDVDGKEYVTFQIILNKNGDIKVQLNSDLSSINTEKISGVDAYSIVDNMVMGITDDTESSDNNRKEVTYRRYQGPGTLFDENNTPPSSLAVIFTKSEPTTLSNEVYTKKENTIRVYPNPVKDVLNIKTVNTVKEVTIYTISGKKLLAVKNTNNINVASLPQGIYLLKVLTKRGVETLKIIKE